MKKTKEFKKSQQGFLAIYATLVMLMLFFIVTAWGPMMSQMAVKNVEIEKSLGAEYLAAGELSRVAGYIKNNTMMSDRDILDKVSTKDDLKYYNLKVNDDDTDSDIDDFTFAIYTDPDLNYSSSEFVVTAIAKYNGTTKIARKTVVRGSVNLESTALLAAQKAAHALYLDGQSFKNGNQLSSAIALYNQLLDTGDYILYEETNESFINKLLGTTDYKTELGIDKLYWAADIENKEGETDIVYYLAEDSLGKNSNKGWAIALLNDAAISSPTVEDFVYYRGLAVTNKDVREATKLKDTSDWEEVEIY